MTKKASPDGPKQERDLAGFLQDWTTLWREEMLAQLQEPGPLAGMVSYGMSPEVASAMEVWRTLITLPVEAPASPSSAMVRSRERAVTPRTQAVAVAPDARDAEIERLTRRIDELEGRLARLEAPRRDRG